MKKHLIRNISTSIILVIVFCFGYVNYVGQENELPIPVLGADSSSWDIKSYWSSPWGKSRVHKGVDIFAPRKTPIISPVNGIVISSVQGTNRTWDSFTHVSNSEEGVYTAGTIEVLEFKPTMHMDYNSAHWSYVDIDYKLKVTVGILGVSLPPYTTSTYNSVANFDVNFNKINL